MHSSHLPGSLSQPIDRNPVTSFLLIKQLPSDALNTIISELLILPLSPKRGQNRFKRPLLRCHDADFCV